VEMFKSLSINTKSMVRSLTYGFGFSTTAFYLLYFFNGKPTEETLEYLRKQNQPITKETEE
jgi:hypothetical protein